MPQHSVLQDTDRCVLCGLCLPHCPTYRLEHREPESPRGRISLVQALFRGKLQADDALTAHLDHCLACRACERMCPSGVAYGRIIDSARERLFEDGLRRTPAALERLLDAVEEPAKLQRRAKALRLYQGSGARRLARSSGLLKGLKLDRLERLLPELPAPRRLDSLYPALGERRGAVGLFTGCIGSLLEGDIQAAAIRLLNRLGYDVHIPPSQGCCGSLHLHHGQRQTAGRLAARNLEAFADPRLDAIVGTGSGCIAQLFEYEAAFGQPLAAPAAEICDFLDRCEWPPEIRLRPLPQRVAIHLPCTQRNVLRRPDAVRRLLQRIPAIELLDLPDNDLCCGAAGSYQISEPERADALAALKRQAVAAAEADLLISNNIGCANHIAAGTSLSFLHPLLLLDRQLAVEGTCNN